LRRIPSLPDPPIGFCDAGAHLRNMPFYDIPRFVPCMAHDAATRRPPLMSTQRAVHERTGATDASTGVEVGVPG
jgi:N-acyl-D-glutamate deacylase